MYRISFVAPAVDPSRSFLKNYLLEFGVEVVGGSLGFPVAAAEIEGVDLFAADAGGELRDEAPVGFFGGGVEEILESGVRGDFVIDFVRGVADEFFVVSCDFLDGPGFE
jgi:hypothetical protein